MIKSSHESTTVPSDRDGSTTELKASNDRGKFAPLKPVKLESSPSPYVNPVKLPEPSYNSGSKSV